MCSVRYVKYRDMCTNIKIKFDDLKKKFLDCYFTVGSIAEKSKQRPGIRFKS